MKKYQLTEDMAAQDRKYWMTKRWSRKVRKVRKTDTYMLPCWVGFSKSVRRVSTEPSLGLGDTVGAALLGSSSYELAASRSHTSVSPMFGMVGCVWLSHWCRRK